MPTRELLGNVPPWAEVAMYGGTALVFLLLTTDLARRVNMYRQGRPAASPRGDHWPARLADLVLNGLLQKAVLADRYAGFMHLGLFWGFVVLLLGTIILIFPIDFGLDFFRGNFYLVFSFFMELGGLALLAGVLLAAWRRYGRRPAKLERRWDDHYALAILFLLGVTGFLLEGARIYGDGFPPFERGASFVGYGVGRVLALFAGPETFTRVHRSLWVVHMALGVGFVGLVSYTKFLHTLTGPANIFLRDRRPKGAMTFVPDVEEAERVGVGTITDYPWPDLKDLDACMGCGRCEEACPATAAGKPLNPKSIVLKSRAVMRARLNDDPDRPADTPDLYDLITDPEVWSCTTCRSCVEHCPVAINQLDKILELRRFLTNEGRLVGSAAKALESMSMRGNPWQLKQEDRLAWAAGLDVEVPVLALLQDPEARPAGEEPPPVDYLFFVGCAGSYDPRAQKVTRALVRLLTRAGVSFAVLGEEETCTCEAARRMGEEMLFQVGAGALKETIDQYRFRAILTQCPHCYNTFKNDYPQLGAHWPVVHHTELLRTLLAEGRLRAPAGPGLTLTYHDSCYLGRYNDLYAAPREVAARVEGATLLEPERHGRDGFCCGGGGGRMWAEIKIGEPVEFLRARELVATGAQVVATACPFCKIMLDDGVKHEGLEGQVAVRDLAEIIDGAVSTPGG
ncbi:MAG: heterodisulfide reductase-related iron-sulfur binding cluster [Deferrisomatales bacterium]